MKKLGLLLLAGVVAFGLGSCTGDDGEEAKPTPKFDFKTGAGYTSSLNVTIAAENTLKFGIDATGSENLTSVGLRVSQGGGAETIFPITADGDSVIEDLKTKNFQMDIEYPVGSIPGVFSLKFIVKMNNGTQSSKTVTVTVTKTAQPLTERPNLEMGAQNNATYGSYWSLGDNQAKLQAEANADPANIDWIYFYGTSGQLATFAAPDDALFNSTTNIMGNSQIPGWSKRSKTRFKKVSIDFDAASTTAEIDAELTTAPTATQIADLKVGDVLIFVSEGNVEYGLIKITGFSSASATGTIQFDMKVAS